MPLIATPPTPLTCSDPTCRDGILGILTESGRPIHCDECCSSIGVLITVDTDDAFDAYDCYDQHHFPYPTRELAQV